MNKSLFVTLLAFLALAVCFVHGGQQDNIYSRVKRGGGGHGGGGGGHGGGYPGAGGGAAGPVYICGYIGSKEGSSGYGGYGRK